MDFPHLTSPGAIGTLTLPNRIAMCPMGILFGEEDGSVGDREAAFYERRARGGAGLLIQGTACVAYPHGANHERMPAVSDDRYLPGMERLVAGVHRQGGRIAAQLNHMGFYAFLDLVEGRGRLVPFEPARPSPDALSFLAPREEMAAMSAPFLAPGAELGFRVADEDDIAWVVDRFAEAAERCVRAGYDGLELHAGHGYLLDQFLSPRNTRTDGWGGDLEGRARLLLTVIGAIRERIGATFPLWMRINAREYHREVGEVFEEQCAVIDLAQAAGIDAVHVTAYANTDVATSATDSYAPHTVGDLPGFAAEVRRRTGLPVITYGRYEPEEAERILADGGADVIAFGRRLLADPDLPRLLAGGEREAIRPCAYQYRCIGNIALRERAECSINADLGRESEPALALGGSRRVLVVGGGPAGMEVARLLAGAGADVRLQEAAGALGGRLADAGALDGPLAQLRDWLEAQVRAAGVEVVCGRPFDDPAGAEGFDDVVVATGASWQPADPALPGALGVADLGAWLREDDGTVGARVAVVGVGKAGLAIARAAVDRGRTVVLVSAEAYVAPQLGMPGRARMVADYLAAGGELLTRAAPSWDGSTLRVDVGGGELQERAVDTVILADPVPVPTPAWADGIVAPTRVHVLGDAAGPGALVGAFHGAADLARTIATAADT
ncbi:MAG: hypothetical protein JNK12_20615 [Acidimicrobiales bacterium]|nr:hypothetical protein [Acidimicrobiales bacterium]